MSPPLSRPSSAGLLTLGEGPQTTAVALLLLRRLAADPRVAAALLQEGAEGRLRELLLACPPELAGSAEALLALLLDGGDDGGGGSGGYGSAGVRGGGGIPTPTAPLPAEPLLPHTHGAAAPAARRSLFELPGARFAGAASEAAAAPPPVFGGGARGVDSPAPQAWDAAAAQQWARPPPFGVPTTAMSPDGLYYDHHQQQQHYHHHHHHHHHQQHAQHLDPGINAVGAAAAGLDEADARALRARARADWRADAAVASAAAAAAPPRPGHLSLPAVALGAADDQHLFELGVRLQYSDDARLVVPALAELAGSAAADFPAEALLQRPGLLESALALLASPTVCREARAGAAELLLRLLLGLQRSLALARDPELAASAYAMSGAAPAAAGVAVPGEAAAAGSRAGAPQHGGGELLRELVAGVRGADPTCADSHPPLPLPPAGLADAWRQLPGQAERGAQRVDVTAAVHSIVLQALDLARLPDRHFELLPIVEAALPLLCAPLAHFLPPGGGGGGSGGSGSSSGGTAMAAAAAAAAGVASGVNAPVGPEQRAALRDALRAQWRGMLAALARALSSSLAVARAERAAAAAGGDGGALASEALAGSGLVAWDPCSANLLLLALRLVNEAPTDWCTDDVVPQAIADAAEAAALDEAAALALPALRPAARRLLAALRPGALLALEGAGAAHEALAAADRAGVELPGLLAAAARAASSPAAGDALAAAAAAWLASLREALGALGRGAPDADRRLLDVTARGLAAAAAVDGDGGVTADAAADLLVRLLSFNVAGGSSCGAGREAEAVRDAAYRALAEAVDAARGPTAAGAPPAAGMRRLLLAPAALAHIATAGLAAPGTRRAAAHVLLSLAHNGGAEAARALLEWRAWVDCHRHAAAADGDGADADTVAPLAEALDAAGESGAWRARRGSFSWADAEPLVRRLFSKSPSDRAAAARTLRALAAPSRPASPWDDFGTAGAAAAAAHSSSPDREADPLRGVVFDAGDPGARPDPVLDASPALAVEFAEADAAALLDVALNTSLAGDLRRSAAEQLLALAAAPHLAGLLAGAARLEALWRVAAAAWGGGGDGGAGDGGSDGGGCGGPETLLDLQLPVAALALLFCAAARGPEALRWLRSDPDRLLAPALPLLFHPLTSVRRAAARLLAVAVFGGETLRCASFAPSAAAAVAAADATYGAGGALRCLVPPGGRALLLPAPFAAAYKFPFRVVPVEIAAAGADSASASQATAGAASTAASRRLVAQQRLLRAAGGDAAAARRLLDAPQTGALDAPPALVRATAATLAALDFPALAAAALEAVANARSHPECAQALRALRRLASSSAPGLRALAAAPWGAALGRLLGAAPVTEDDQRLWLELLPLVERALLGAHWPQGQYAHLAVLLRQSALPWLRQPGAVDDAGRPPLAAIEAEVAEDAVTGALAPATARRLRVAVSRRALQTLLQLLRAARRHGGGGAQMDALRALGGPQFLVMLATGVVGRPDGDAACRALAAAALEEALAALQAARMAPSRHGGAANLNGEEPCWENSLLACLEPLVARALMPIAAQRAAGFRLKALARPALRCLAALPRLLPVDVWAGAWAAVGGTFWLSRCGPRLHLVAA